MEISNQIWKDRDLTPLVDNKVDLVVIDETPTCQVEIYNFLSQYYEVCPQDPLNQIFVSIQNNPVHRDSLRSETELAWHIDGIYKERPYNITGLYCVDIDGRADTQFVDNRIIDLIPEYYEEYKEDLAVIDVAKLTDDSRYPYLFKNDREKRLFQRYYGKARHKMFQYDKRGPYIYYSNSSSFCDRSDFIDETLYAEDRIYSHEWKKRQLVIANNITTNHRRAANDSKSRHMWKVCGWNLNS